MKKLLLVIALFAVAGCTGETNLPNPTGKGTIRALNAIPASPDVAFRIEEFFLESVPYKSASAGQSYDDFEYTFNFDVFFAGESESRRIVSRVLKVDAERDYTIAISGDINSPTVSVWEEAERSFDTADTVFEARFAHTAVSLQAVDLYFAPAATPLVLGEQRGTLNFGERLSPMDIAEGDYVLTITDAGTDPTVQQNIRYQSEEINYVAQSTLIIPVFEGDENDTAPYVARVINATGGLINLTDTRFPPTVRIFQASFSLPPADVYDDEMLTNLVLPNHQFGDISGDIDIPVGVTSYTYTPVGNTGAVLFESGISAVEGRHYNFIVIGDTGNEVATTFVPDRRSDSSVIKMRVYHAAFNHSGIDMYIVPRGEAFAGAPRAAANLLLSLQSANIVLEEGSFDIYVTPTGDDTVVLAGPIAIDPVFGDVIEGLLLDVVDPAVLEFRIVPAP